MRPTCALLLLLLSGCGAGAATAPRRVPAPVEEAFLDTLQHRTFDFFWETTNPRNGLVPDRWPTLTFSSVAAVGFGLSAYLVGAERGWITREEARDRTLTTLRFLWNAPQGPQPTGVTGYRGFFYHFLDLESGERFKDVELSTIDTALLMAGVLSSAEYFDRAEPAEAEIRALADSLYRRVDWAWAAEPRSPAVSMGWTPEHGFHGYDYLGYNEAMILYLLALGSPTHPAPAGAWDRYTSTYRWGEFHGEEHLGFAPLFGHQYSHVWVDFRGIQDAFMRAHGSDYFQNSRRATLAQRAYARENPIGWKGYGGDVWGLTACDGPGDTTFAAAGRERRFFGYAARGADFTEVRDDGTIAPTAAGGSVPFAPEVAIPALQAMRARYGEHLFSRYGFRDAFNPTFQAPSGERTGEVVPGVGWFDRDYLGIDQGPIVLMIENHRSGLLWKLMRKNPYLREGLRRAGFTGGWLDAP